MDSRHVSLKAPVQPFSVSETPVRQIYFLHPHYADGENILLVLPAIDDDGVHHETARVACGIIANSRWDGFFSTTRDGDRIEYDPDGILTAAEYFFRLDDEDHYPIVPSFHHYRFPSRLPPSWVIPTITPSATDRVPDRDRTCRITCSSMPNEIAHIIPSAQEAWWQSNAMFRHTARPEKSLNTNSPENALLLRRDLHYLWDWHRFAIVPKQDRWAVHVLSCLPTVELQDQYHNLEMQPISGVSREFLLARFAFAILTDKTFIARQSVSRALILLEDKKPRVRHLSGPECHALFGQRDKSRSQSPKKRSRSTTTQGNELDTEADGMEADWVRDQWCANEQPSDSSEDEGDRGRPRKRPRRSSSHESLPSLNASYATIDSGSAGHTSGHLHHVGDPLAHSSQHKDDDDFGVEVIQSSAHSRNSMPWSSRSRPEENNY